LTEQIEQFKPDSMTKRFPDTRKLFEKACFQAAGIPAQEFKIVLE
jgi:hypothetical protein